MNRFRIISRYLSAKMKNVGERQFMLFLSALIGLCVGLAAVVVKNMVHFMQLFLTGGLIGSFHTFFYFIFPTIGILITVIFITYINRKPVKHGIPAVLYGISKNQGVIHRHNMYSSVITSALTVGFGGSVGLEGPTVITGAAIGSNIARFFRLNYKQVILCIGCACAGAMASIFKAPIAAIVFALEVIMLDLTMASLVPLLIASLSAALTSYLFLGQNVLYAFRVDEPFMMGEIPYYILLGIMAGLLSFYFTRMYMYVTNQFWKLKNRWTRLLTGGLLLGFLIFLFPSLYGEGYEPINNCLNGNYSYLFDNTVYERFSDNIAASLVILFLILIFKVVATSVTFGSGGIGGIFAPSLFIGTNLGLFFAKTMNLLGSDISQTNFTLVGMAGMIAGIIHAPLTAIFLIAEITGGYQLFIPLMIVSTISYATTRIYTKNSIYTIQLAKRGELFTHDKDKNVLILMKIDKLIETDFHAVHPENTLGDLIQIIKKSSRNIFPVVDEQMNFYGLVKLDDIRKIMFNTDLYKTTSVRDLMFMPGFTISKNESMAEIVKKFQTSGRFNIVVLEDGKYAGFISRARIFSVYREMMKDISDD